MNKPNFLIAGAAKSGTTSLVDYIKQHPDIFIPDIKEPRYFVSSVLKNISEKDPLYNQIMETSVFDEGDYYKLFDTKIKYRRYGEASIHYLYHHKECIPQIKSKLGDIPIIIILREPAKRALSNYYFLKNHIRMTFKECLINEKNIIASNFNSFWYFKAQGFYYDQVKSYLDNFTKVKIIKFDDLIKDTIVVCKEIFYFLEVDNNVKPNVTFKSNQTKIYRNKYINLLLRVEKDLELIKQIIPASIFNYLRKFKKKNYFKRPLYDKYQDEINILKKIYVKDIDKLEKLINIDLSIWK